MPRRCARSCAKRGIDVMILTHQQKYSYVSGNFHNDFNLGNCIFVWADQEPTLLVAIAEWRRLKYEGYIKDIRFWKSPYSGMEPVSFLEVANQILHEHDCEQATIAVELPSIPYRLYHDLETEFPRATIVDGEKMINDIMMIKDEEELEITRRVCAMGDAAQQKIIEYARVGITEAELMGHCEQEMRRLGATWYYTPNQCNFGAASAAATTCPRERSCAGTTFSTPTSIPSGTSIAPTPSAPGASASRAGSSAR